MNEDDFQKRLDALKRSIEELPDGPERRQLNAHAGQIAKNRGERQVALEAFQQSVDVLRVHIKYIVFDLEATKREASDLKDELEVLKDQNDQLKKRLQDRDEECDED
jgi:chromosome segregation ATPase